MFVRLEALPTELVAAAGARHMIAAHVLLNLPETLARQFTTRVTCQITVEIDCSMQMADVCEFLPATRSPWDMA